MIKRTVIYIVLLLVTVAARSQEFANRINIGLDYEIASSSISNNFTNAFLFSDRIDITQKQKMFSSLQQSNYMGADVNQYLNFNLVFDTLLSCQNIGITAGIYNNYHIDMTFTDDLMELFFSGNKSFEGKTAKLSGSSLNMMQYQIFQLGLVKQFKTEHATHTIAVAPGYVNGNNYTNIKFNNASLYTAPDAEYINLNAAFEAVFSDTASLGKYSGKGKGISLNLHYDYICKNNNAFFIDISDLGFIQWNNNTLTSTKDTSIHFEGVAVDDILNIQENVFGNANTDSIKQDYIYSGTHGSVRVNLPARFEIGFSKKLKNNLSLFAGLKKRIFSNYKLQYSAGAKINFQKNASIALNLNHGGYSSTRMADDINLGFEIEKTFYKKLRLILGSNSLNGFVFGNSVTSQGIYCSLSLLLK